MTHISPVSETSYAYLATLSRLDTNGDGVLSRGERAAEEKPGILKRLSDDDTARQSRSTATSDVLALMMNLGQVSSSDESSPVGASDRASELYRRTYGQYDPDVGYWA
ncbi:hypothetical protein HGP14_06390 [Rhizobium sp. P32RR-XVIII]|uniref:hypothetical protein n=1 Tax=Rhizobium sp. P32RR-XVIII TaxID=2726738 RepID=UPI001456F09A|nr:hypothetical protein [Rhizobium sp. P32RR-XVIII]NLS03000.1 hypothetical protein [Rhizobium sp. P32RR-XVIII]